MHRTNLALDVSCQEPQESPSPLTIDEIKPDANRGR